MNMQKYVKPTAVDSPTVGNLYQARRWKANAWNGVKSLRQQIRDHNGHGTGMLRLELLKAERAHFDATMSEKSCLRIIEARANELGQTTIKAKTSAV